MAEKPRLVPTTVVYEVGKDISTEKYNELVQNIGDWYAESRKNLREPVAMARQNLECCLKGVKPSNPEVLWKGIEVAPFATRVRIACRYDMDKMEPIRTSSEKSKEKKAKQQIRDERKRLRAKEDMNIPDELRKELKNSAKYGDDPRVFLSSEEAKNWQALHDEYTRQFPELATINAAAELDMLCDLLIVSARHRMKILKGETVDQMDAKGVTDQIIQLKKALNIHPEQVAKRVQTQTGGSVGELVRRLEEMPNWKEVRAKFFTEEMLQIFQMYMTPSPREDLGGYQLDEIGLFGLTRCRTCHCANCGHKNYVGIAINEVEDYLVNEGVLVQLKRAPQTEGVRTESAPSGVPEGRDTDAGAARPATPPESDAVTQES
jgi:hypothetical protein